MRTPHRRGNPTGPTLSALFRVFLDIALLRSGPQVLPASGLLLALCFALYAATYLAVIATTALELRALAAQVVASIAIDVVGLWLVLAAGRRQARYPQALAALFGAGTILNLALLPVAVLVAEGGPRFELAGALAGSVVMGWGLAVLAHILRHALEIAWGLALALGAAYLFVSIVAQRALGAG
jgi:hypothetical protein